MRIRWRVAKSLSSNCHWYRPTNTLQPKWHAIQTSYCNTHLLNKTQVWNCFSLIQSGEHWIIIPTRRVLKDKKILLWNCLRSHESYLSTIHIFSETSSMLFSLINSCHSTSRALLETEDNGDRLRGWDVFMSFHLNKYFCWVCSTYDININYTHRWDNVLLFCFIGFLWKSTLFLPWTIDRIYERTTLVM